MADARIHQQNQESWIGRITDYLFGRNTLIGVASLMLLAISGFATWSGMNDFIVGVSQTSKVSKGPAGLSVSNEFLVIAIVVALTFLMWLALRESFGAKTLLARTADYVSTLPVPSALVCRFWIRVLVEFDRR